MNATDEIKTLATQHDGELPTQSLGYPIIYLDNHNNVFCAACAAERDELDQPIVHYDIYYEGPSIECDGSCGNFLESAYGDPEDEQCH